MLCWCPAGGGVWSAASTEPNGSGLTRRRAGSDMGRSSWETFPIVAFNMLIWMATVIPRSWRSAQARAPASRTLQGISIETGRALWTQAIDGHFDQSKWGVPVANIPLVVDLAALGRPGIVVADSGAMPPLSGYRGLRLIDGRTGTTRWRRAMRPQTAGADGLAHVIVAPDLDGDGMRDLITVSGFVGRTPPVALTAHREEPMRVYVDAVSGRDGRVLWFWKLDLPFWKLTRIWAPQWWGCGPDDWPLLAVPVGGGPLPGLENKMTYEFRNSPSMHLLEASSGIERHTLEGISCASLPTSTMTA